MARVLVPDSLSIATLATVRSLWRRGDRCDLASPSSPIERLMRGRAVEDWVGVASATTEMARFVEDLVESCAGGRYDIVLPTTHLSTHVVSLHSGRLSPLVRVIEPGWDSFRSADDKVEMTRHASRIGIPCPEIHADADIDAIADEIRYPVVVKRRSGSAAGLYFASDPVQLLAAAEATRSIQTRTPVEVGAPLIQEYIPGPVHDACAICHEGEVVNVLTQMRERMVPISGGVGAIVTTTDVPEVRHQAIDLLESLQWNGPAQIEFKHDERDGTYKFIELNPRLWGTLDASIRAGMDFPAQLRDLALGQAVERGQTYQVGLRYRFLFYRALRAYHQTARTFGLRRLLKSRGPRDASRSVGDVDWRDPLPDLYRVISGAPHFARDLIRGERSAGRREIPLELTPRS